MKNHFLVYIIFALILVSCKQDTNNPVSPINVSGPDVCMLIVKYPNADYLNYVVASPHIEDFRYEQTPIYMNNDSTSLYLYRPYTSEILLRFVEQEKLLAGTSPYVPLTNDYYLIDWKWQRFYPLSYYGEDLFSFQYPNYIRRYLPYTFLTGIKWEDLVSVADTFQLSQCSTNLEGTEVVAVTYHAVDKLYNEEKGDNFYLMGCYIYKAFSYDETDSTMTTYQVNHDYIHYCDSLQRVYQQRLIEVINNGQLLKIGFQCP